MKHNNERLFMALNEPGNMAYFGKNERMFVNNKTGVEKRIKKDEKRGRYFRARLQ
jgi:hypothetical protein